MEKIIIWLIEILMKFQKSFVLAGKKSGEEEISLTIIQSIALSDKAQIKTLGWEIKVMSDGKYSARRVFEKDIDSAQEVRGGIPFIAAGVPAIFIIFDEHLFECKIIKKNQD